MREPAPAGKRTEGIERLVAENQALRERLERREQELLAANRMMAQVLNQNVARLEALQQRTRQLEAVGAVGIALAGVADLSQVLETALDQALEALGQPMASIYLLEGEELVLKAHRGFTPEIVAELGRLKPGGGLAGRMLQDGEPLSVDDLTAEEGWPLPTMGNARSAAVVPLKWRGQAIGTMTVASSTVGKLAPEELNCLVTLAATLAFFIAHSRLDAQLQEKEHTLSLLTELSHLLSTSPAIEAVYESFVARLKALADIARAVLVTVEEGQLCSVALYPVGGDPPGRQGTIPVKDSPGEWLAASGQSLYQPDLEQERRFWTDEAFLKAGVRCSLCLPLVHQAKFIGYLHLQSKRPHAYDDPGLRRLLEEGAAGLAPAIAHQQLHREFSQSQQKLETYVRELERATMEAGLSWVRALETRYPHYRGHSSRVAFYTARLASHLGLSQGEVRTIMLGGYLHDIGLLLVPDVADLSPGPPTPDQENRLRLHPACGAEHLSAYPFAQQLLPIIRHHHERYDGMGYPDGLRGEAIPLGARLVAVADAYDGMVGYRMRQMPVSQPEAASRLREGAGGQWDPQVVEALFQVMTSLEEIEPGPPMRPFA